MYKIAICNLIFLYPEIFCKLKRVDQILRVVFFIKSEVFTYMFNWFNTLTTSQILAYRNTTLLVFDAVYLTRVI
jgi:hypothetical protein